MLEDDALAGGCLCGDRAGAPADHAWRGALDREIAGYEAAEDEYFRARAADLADLRDRVLDALAGANARAIPPGAIVFAADLTPSRFLAADWGGGAIVLSDGSPTSHVAMLARGRGVPMVVGVGDAPAPPGRGRKRSSTATKGLVLIGPDERDLDEFRSRQITAAGTAACEAGFRLKPGVTADGDPDRRPCSMSPTSGNSTASTPRPATASASCARNSSLAANGLGEEEQVRRLPEHCRMGGRPAGDHPHPRCRRRQADPGVTDEAESEPLPRAARHPALAEAPASSSAAQLRALARAAAFGRVKVMVPMVTIPEELAAARALLDEAIAALAEAGMPRGRPPLGIMVEVPAAAVAIDLLRRPISSRSARTT